MAQEGVKKLIKEQKQLTQRRQDAKGRQANKVVLHCASLRLCAFA
jgi:cold shock CspA family protein